MRESVLIDLMRKAALVRRDVVDAVYHAGSGHIGGALSSTDVLVALYFHVLRFDAKRLDWPDRDRLVMSKGHCCAAMYACLARLGVFPLAELRGLRTTGHFLQGHPDPRKTPGVEFTGGSLGHTPRQARLLKAEGVFMDPRHRVPLEVFGWAGPRLPALPTLQGTPRR